MTYNSGSSQIGPSPNYSFKGNSHRTDAYPLNSGVRPQVNRFVPAIVLLSALLSACSDQSEASQEAPAVDYAKPQAGCIELNGAGAAADPRLVAQGEDRTRQDARSATFYKAVPSADGTRLFYVFASNRFTDIYVVFETDAAGRRFTNAFQYGSLHYPCRAGDRL